MTKLTDNQAWALKMIRKFGRSTDKRAVDGLVRKGLVYPYYDARPIGGDWLRSEVTAYFCTEKENNYV